MTLVLKGQQPQAFDAVVKWWKTPPRQRKQVFRLYGGAGVGKTTVAMKFQELAPVEFMTLSGKAALVMRKKGCAGARTIHYSIYRVDEDNLGNPVFKLNRDALNPAYVKLIVVDEVGMVDEELGRDLESFGIPILVLGDPNQLPPPNGNDAYFTSQPPDFLMTEVLRQAKDSPIIDLAYQALETGKVKVGKYGDSEVFSDRVRDSKVRELMLGADQVLCGKNATRTVNNLQMRRWLNLNGNEHDYLPVVGDRLICLRNDHEKGTLNGEQFMLEVMEYKDLGRISTFKATSIDIEGAPQLDFEVPFNFWNGTDANIPAYEKRNWDQMTYAYALTVHKAQGSQWDNVLVLDESSAFREKKRNHLYTAITRAAEKVFIV